MTHGRLCPNGLTELNSLRIAVTKEVSTALYVREIKIPSSLFIDEHRLVNSAHSDAQPLAGSVDSEAKVDLCFSCSTQTPLSSTVFRVTVTSLGDNCSSLSRSQISHRLPHRRPFPEQGGSRGHSPQSWYRAYCARYGRILLRCSAGDWQET
jgi:hypothetical protein